MNEPTEESPPVSLATRLAHPELLPSQRKFLQWIRNGRTFREIEAECAERAGLSLDDLGTMDRWRLTMRVDHEITDAMTLHGLGHRYDDCTPWRVLEAHRQAHQFQMLQLLGRRRCGQPLGPSSTSSLDSFLFLLGRARLVVAYCPALEDGFAYVPEAWRSGPNEDIPICVPELPLDEIEWIASRWP